jgi:cytochrome b6-f complex iron-sulfur subunit
VIADINNVPIFIAGAVVIVLAVFLVIGTFGRKSSRAGTGQLARETYQRDKASHVDGAPSGDDGDKVAVGATGAEIERAARIDRIGGELVPKEKGDLSPFVPPDPEAIGVTRRQFFNRSIVAFMILGISGFGAAVLGFLWPVPKGGFGSKIKVGKISDINANITSGKGFYYLAEGRMWITQYPLADVDKAAKVYPPPVLNSLKAGIAVMYQKCPHLGCRVPSCATSQWFECPCHGSQYNRVGEKKGGPAPRGMDRFTTEVDGDELTVDTGTVFQGPPIGTNTTGQEAEGPHCVTGSGGH